MTPGGVVRFFSEKLAAQTGTQVQIACGIGAIGERGKYRNSIRYPSTLSMLSTFSRPPEGGLFGGSPYARTNRHRPLGGPAVGTGCVLQLVRHCQADRYHYRCDLPGLSRRTISSYDGN